MSLTGFCQRIMNPVIDQFGNKFWRNEKGQLHREDGPAIEYASGQKEWYLNGQCHREFAPAIEYVDGTKLWYLNGKLHREGGPAREFADGHKEWWQNDKLHRLDGPAVTYPKNSAFAGLDGWWIDGRPIQKEHIAVMKVLSDLFKQLPEVLKNID